jgi:hypothetical protein
MQFGSIWRSVVRCHPREHDPERTTGNPVTDSWNSGPLLSLIDGDREAQEPPGATLSVSVVGNIVQKRGVQVMPATGHAAGTIPLQTFRPSGAPMRRLGAGVLCAGLAALAAITVFSSRATVSGGGSAGQFASAP